MKCDRCHAAHGNISMVNLIGGYPACVCTECARIWHFKITNSRESERHDRVNARMNFLRGRAMSGDAPTEEEWMQVETERNEINKIFMAMAKDWLVEEA